MTIAFWAGLGFSAFAIYLLKHALLSHVEAKRSLQWPHVDGTLLECRSVQWKATSSHRTLFVKYEYVVSGKQYAATRVSMYSLAGDEVLQIEEQLNSRKNHVPVYYDPEAPDKSTLITGPRKEKAHSDVIMATIALAVGIAISVAGYFGKIG